METKVENNVKEFYGKLLHCEAKSGKMRWNAICEDLVTLYEHSFEEKKRLIPSRELYSLLFEPYQKQEVNKKKLNNLFQNTTYQQFFMEKLYNGLDDPKDWPEWISHFRY